MKKGSHCNSTCSSGADLAKLSSTGSFRLCNSTQAAAGAWGKSCPELGRMRMQGRVWNESLCTLHVDNQTPGLRAAPASPTAPAGAVCRQIGNETPAWALLSALGTGQLLEPSLPKHSCSQRSQGLSSCLSFTKFSQGWMLSVLLLAKPFTHLSL